MLYEADFIFVQNPFFSQASIRDIFLSKQSQFQSRWLALSVFLKFHALNDCENLEEKISSKVYYRTGVLQSSNTYASLIQGQGFVRVRRNKYMNYS